MLKYCQVLCTIAGLIVMPASVSAQETRSTPELLQELWNGPNLDINSFAPEVFNKVSKNYLEEILSEQREVYGPALGVQPTADTHRFLIETETYSVPALIKQNAAGQLTGLLFRYGHIKGLGHEDLLEHIREQTKKQSYVLMENGEVHAEHNSNVRMAVGSAFKLFVLDELAQQIEAGTFDWDEKVMLEQRHISFPSGTMQQEPVGKMFALLDVARNMISVSDNTATDLLMDVIGQENVMLPGATSPALTTRQLFHLKADKHAAEAYLKAGPEERAHILTDLPARLPAIDQVSGPLIDGIEWYVSTRELCEVLTELKDIKGIFVSPGVADPDNWTALAYKGGSETGVLNMTYALEDQEGNEWCFSTTWNAKEALDNTYLIALVATLLESPQALEAALR